LPSGGVVARRRGPLGIVKKRLVEFKEEKQIKKKRTKLKFLFL
jgi:hypothetical protein